MREINNISFQTDDDLRAIARDSMEYDVTSHGGSVNKGDGIVCDEIFKKYKVNSIELASAFEEFSMDLLVKQTSESK
jgi:hypothetical protein